MNRKQRLQAAYNAGFKAAQKNTAIKARYVITKPQVDNADQKQAASDWYDAALMAVSSLNQCFTDTTKLWDDFEYSPNIQAFTEAYDSSLMQFIGDNLLDITALEKSFDEIFDRINNSQGKY